MNLIFCSNEFQLKVLSGLLQTSEQDFKHFFSFLDFLSFFAFRKILSELRLDGHSIIWIFSDDRDFGR